MTKNIRDKEGLTQKEIAKYLGVSSITVSRWERRVQNPSAKNLKKIIFLEDMIEGYTFLEDGREFRYVKHGHNTPIEKTTIWTRIIKFLKGE